MVSLTVVQAINAALREALESDPRVVLLGEDVGKDGGVFRVTEGLYQLYGENRVIDTPLSELGIIGVSIGLALNGMRPIPEIQFDGFIYSGFDQIVSHMSRYRNRTRGRYTCPVVVRVPYGGGIKALEHHSETPEAFFAHIPGVRVVIPSGPYDAKGMLLAAIKNPDPVIFFEPKRVYRAIKEDVPEEPYTVELDKAKIKREGEDITLIAWGSMVRTCMDAAEKMKNETTCEVIDVRSISPLDTEAILNSVKKTGRAVIVQEAHKSFSVASEISALISEKELLSLEAPVIRVTGYDVVTPYPKLEDYYIPDSFRVVRAIKQSLNF